MAAKEQFSQEKVVRQRISVSVHAEEPELLPLDRYEDEDEQVYFGFRV